MGPASPSEGEPRSMRLASRVLVATVVSTVVLASSVGCISKFSRNLALKSTSSVLYSASAVDADGVRLRARAARRSRRAQDRRGLLDRRSQARAHGEAGPDPHRGLLPVRHRVRRGRLGGREVQEGPRRRSSTTTPARTTSSRAASTTRCRRSGRGGRRRSSGPRGRREAGRRRPGATSGSRCCSRASRSAR